jgi:hypothetical protein
LFDDATLIMVRYAYTLLESIPAMVNERRAPGNPQFSHGGWIDAELPQIQKAFFDADRALENLKRQLDQWADHRLDKRLQKLASDLRLRIIAKVNRK